MSIYIGKCSELCTVKHGMQSMDDLNTIHTQNNKMKISILYNCIIDINLSIFLLLICVDTLR